MSQLAKLEVKLGENLQKRMAEPVQAMTADEQVVTFDWSSILAILFPMLLDFLEGCLTRTSVEEITTEVTQLNGFGQWALSRKIRKERDIPASLRGKCHGACVETLEGATADEIKAGIEEFQNKATDWGLF